MRAALLIAVALAACTFPEKQPGVIDSGVVDAPLDDAPLIDAAAIDAAVIDAAVIDAAVIDAAVIDAPPIDAPPIDAPPIDAAVDAPPIDAPPPWTWQVTTTNVNFLLDDVYGTAANDVYAVGQDGTILHWNGSVWQTQASSTFLSLFGVWTNGSRAWAVGDFGVLNRKDGSGAWVPATAPTGNSIYYYGVWGSATSDVFAVGLDGNILRHNGNAWSASIHGTADLAAIHGSSASDIYAVGEGGAIWHWAGGSWASENSTLISQLNGVHAMPLGVAYAVGSTGKILRRNGGSWTQLTSPTTSTLLDVFATSSGIWIVGSSGLVLFSDGASAFAQVTVPTAESLFHVWVAPTGEVFAVGSNGTAIRYGPP